jgi:hypothetical protein
MALHLVNQCDFLSTQNVVLDKGNCKGRTTTVLFVLEGTHASLPLDPDLAALPPGSGVLAAAGGEGGSA